jgi:hypothetical protein
MRPTADVVAQELGVMVDAQFLRYYDAAVEEQCQACYVDPYTPALADALVYRVQNKLAGAAHTLGTYDTGGDFGVQYTPQYDPRIDKAERHRRRIAIA